MHACQRQYQKRNATRAQRKLIGNVRGDFFYHASQVSRDGELNTVFLLKIRGIDAHAVGACCIVT
jgi:hypothetical protein